MHRFCPASLSFPATQPPELHPYNFPELLLLPVSPLKEHDHQIRMEAILSRNLDAALRNTRKPYMLEPTAGMKCLLCISTSFDIVSLRCGILWQG